MNQTDPNVQHLEHRFNDFIQTTNKRLEENNNKLDLLIDLTRQMAVLQEKQDHNTEDIRKMDKKILEQDTETHKLVQELEAKFLRAEVERNASIQRLHKRIDDLNAHHDDDIQKCAITTATHKKEIIEEIEEVEDTVEKLNDDYKNRVSFFKGIFIAFAAFSSIGQAVIYKYFNDIEKTMNESRIMIQKMENRFNETERQIDLIHQVVKQKVQK